MKLEIWRPIVSLVMITALAAGAVTGCSDSPKDGSA